MSVRLMVRQRSEAGGADKPQEIVLDEPQILIGRDKSCQLVLAQQAVSRQHARITQDGSLFFVEDMGSAYGTQVNSKALPKGEKRLLRNGDIIAVAQFDITFDRLADLPKSAEGAPRQDKTSFIAKAVVKDVMRGIGSAGEGPYFRVMNGPKEGQKIPIEEAQELVIGREEGVDIVFKDDLISRKHAKLRRDWSGVHVEDLGSRNGIKVNKKRTQRKTLKDRDEVEVGGIRLLFLDPSEVREAPVVLPEEGEDTEASSMKEKEKAKAAAEASAEEKEEAPEAPEPSEEQAPPEEEPPADEPAEPEAAGEDEEAPPEEEEPPPEEEEPGEPPEEGKLRPPPGSEELEGGGGLSAMLSDPKKLAVIGVLGLVVLLAFGLIIALLAGA